jgi:hypothetical protein
VIEMHAIGRFGPRGAAEPQGYDDLVASGVVVALHRVGVVPAAADVAAVEDQPLADGGISRTG